MLKPKIILFFAFVGSACCLDGGNENITSLPNRLLQLENVVANLQASCAEQTGSKPAFFVTLSKDFILVRDTVLKFDQIKTNVGNGYNRYTGMFVAPRNGTYSFTAVIYNQYRSYATLQLIKKGETLVKGYSSNSNFANSHTINAVVELNVGDHIYLMHKDFNRETVYGGNHCSFSGFMF